jgi:RNA polymerase sigma-70 factor (ECF subfamily)
MADLNQVLQRCRKGDLCAFTELFTTYQARIYRLAVAILRDERDAEDVVQDVFTYVLEHIHDYRGEAAFSTWLMTIATNRCRDRLRRRKVRQALSLSRLREWSSGENMVELVDQRQQRQTLWSLVDRLDDKHRLPVILRYQEGLRCQDVARVLDLRVSTVYSRLNTARERLRVMFQEQAKVERESCARDLAANEC